MRWDNYDDSRERGRKEGLNRNQQNSGNSQNFSRQRNLGSARSDYGDNAYGGEQRGWMDKASDEVSSWFGDEEANRRRQMDAQRSNYNEYDQNDYHSYQGGYTPKEANPFYPTTNRVFERDNREMRSNQQNQSRQNNFSNQNYRSNQRQGLSSVEDRGENLGNSNQNRWRDWHDTRAGDLMTGNVATVHPFDTVQQAARLMRDEDCGALPVVDRQGRMIGMITDRDITIRLVAHGSDPRFAQVQDCMTDEVYACHVNDPIENCMRAMKEHQVRRMAVTDNQNRVVGIISQGDLARHADMNKYKGERHAFTDMVANVSEPSSWGEHH